MRTLTPINWLPVLNTTAEIVPAGGLMKVIGVDETTAALKITKPDADDDRAVLVNGLALIPAGSMGQGHFDPFCIIAFDATDGQPVAGEVWGVRSGSWLARLGGVGWAILGGAGAGLTNAVRYKTAEEAAAGSGSSGSNSGSGGGTTAVGQFSHKQYRYTCDDDGLHEIEETVTVELEIVNDQIVTTTTAT